MGVTNTLAYYSTKLIMPVKKAYDTAPGTFHYVTKKKD